PGQRAGDLVDGVKRRRVEQVVHLARPVVALVDRRDLRRQHEPDRRAARGRQRLVDGTLQVRPEPEQTGGLGDQLRAELLTPDRVREVAGTDDAYPLAPGPPGEVLQVAVPAASPGELGMYVQIRVEAHRPIIPDGSPFRTSFRLLACRGSGRGRGRPGSPPRLPGRPPPAVR